MSIKVALRLVVMIILLSIFDDDSSFSAHFQSFEKKCELMSRSPHKFLVNTTTSSWLFYSTQQIPPTN